LKTEPYLFFQEENKAPKRKPLSHHPEIFFGKNPENPYPEV